MVLCEREWCWPLQALESGTNFLLLPADRPAFQHANEQPEQVFCISMAQVGHAWNRIDHLVQPVADRLHCGVLRLIER